MTSLSQSTDFKIKKLSIRVSNREIDVSNIFQEVNFFENILTPCMSGNIVIKDATGLAKSLLLQGNEFLRVDIQKSEDSDFLSFQKYYRIYKMSDRKSLTPTSEVFILHFVSEEFLLSEQKKINRVFNDSYDKIVKKILVDDLNIPDQVAFNGNPGISVFEPSKGVNRIVVPNLSPFESINWCLRRSISNSFGLPDFLFFQNPFGYNFVSLNTLLSKDSRYKINFKAKNLSNDDESFSDEVLGARDFKVMKQFNTIENVKKGVYASKFIGIDPLTRRWGKIEYEINNFDEKNGNANRFNLSNGDLTNSDNKTFSQMYDSKVSLYVNQKLRQSSTYIQSNDKSTFNLTDNASEYILPRKYIFGNFLQKIIRIVLPGNFGLFIGENVFLDMPLHAALPTDKSETVDETLSGKYMITAVRHIIRYDKHETIIDVATDTSEIRYG